MSEWRDTTLGSVCELKRGYDLPTSSRSPGEIPIVSSSGITGYHSVAKVRAPGVVTGRYGTLGEVFFIEEDFWPLNTALYVCDFKGNDPRFVAALLQSLDLGRNDGAAAVPGVNRNQLHTLPVLCPDPDTQRRVGLVLGTLDGLIEINRRRIELLEQMAQAIYREWFIHFRYPGHEIAPVESSPGLVPEGWQTTTLGKAAQWLSGGTPSTRNPEYWGGDIPWITSGTLTSLLLDRSERMVTRSGLENGTRLVQRDTLLFVVRGMSLVKEFRVGIADVPLAFGQDCKALIAKPGIRPLFLAFSVISMAEEIQGMVELAGHGTGKLSTDRLKAITIPHPPEQLQVAFEVIVSPLRETSTRLRCSTDKLEAIKVLLLPRLVTGRIDLSSLNLDSVVESVA